RHRRGRGRGQGGGWTWRAPVEACHQCRVFRGRNKSPIGEWIDPELERIPGLLRLGQLVQRQAQVTDAIGVRRRQLARADVHLQRREQQPGDRELRVLLGAQLYVLVFVRVATDVDVVPALVVDRSLGA